MILNTIYISLKIPQRKETNRVANYSYIRYLISTVAPTATLSHLFIQAYIRRIFNIVLSGRETIKNLVRLGTVIIHADTYYSVLRIGISCYSGVRQGGCNIRHPTLREGRAIKPGSIINTSRCRTVKFQEGNVLRVIVTQSKIPVEEGTCESAAKSRICSYGKAI
jgi:hypothetical protein